MNVDVVIKGANIVEEDDEKTVFIYEDVNNPSVFKRVLTHLQLEGIASTIPRVLFADADKNEYQIEMSSKTMDSLINCLKKIEDSILKDWAKYDEKLAKARAKGKEPDAEPPVDNVRYIVKTVVDKNGSVKDMHFDKVITSELMNNAVIIRFDVIKPDALKVIEEGEEEH